MKFTRCTAALSLLVVGTLVLSACGGKNSATTSSTGSNPPSVHVDCGGKIVCSKYPDSSTGAAVKAFMQVTIGAGQGGLDQYGYIPMPSSFQSKLATAVSGIS